MQTLNVVIAQSNPRVAQELTAALEQHFDFVYNACNLDDARHAIAKYRARVAILDVELVSLSEVDNLRRQFAGLCMVCTHRLADEEMWTDAVDAGASDLYDAGDFQGILLAALRRISATRPAAA